MESSMKRKNWQGITLTLFLLFFMIMMHSVTLSVNFSKTIRLEKIASLPAVYHIRLNSRANRLETFQGIVKKRKLAVTETRFLTKDGRGISVKLPTVISKDGELIGTDLSFQMLERGS